MILRSLIHVYGNCDKCQAQVYIPFDVLDWLTDEYLETGQTSTLAKILNGI